MLPELTDVTIGKCYKYVINDAVKYATKQENGY